MESCVCADYRFRYSGCEHRRTLLCAKYDHDCGRYHDYLDDLLSVTT